MAQSVLVCFKDGYWFCGISSSSYGSLSPNTWRLISDLGWNLPPVFAKQRVQAKHRSSPIISSAQCLLLVSPKVGGSVVSHYTWPKEEVTLFAACCMGSVSIWMASGCARVQLAVAIPTQNPCVLLSGQQTGGIPCWEDQRGKLTPSSWTEWGMKRKCSPKVADK